jgi:prevent-host-death family protein
MEIISVNEARAQFSDLMAKVAYGGQRIIVTRRGRPLMAWISIEELHQLEARKFDAQQRREMRSAALSTAAAVREQILRERNGIPLPNSAEVLDLLREERTDELSGVR